MAKAILGTKIGMTQIFGEDGKAIPVTVIQAGPCVVTQVKNNETDGYNAVQVGYKEQKESRINKPLKGHFAKGQIKPVKFLREFRVENSADFKVGQEIKADIFNVGDKVDVTGISKGKGFAGPMKKHGFGRGPETHGSRYHRRTGSLGAVGPQRVFKGSKLPGRMVLTESQFKICYRLLKWMQKETLFSKGAVPGPNKALLLSKLL